MRPKQVWNPDEIEAIRVNVRRLLKEKNIPMARFCAMAIIPQMNLNRFLEGKTFNPGIDMIVSLAKALGVTVSDLVGDNQKS